LGSPSEFLRVPYGLQAYHAGLGEYDLALRLDEDLLRVSRERDDRGGLLLGHLASGRNLLMVGRLVPSRSHLEQALAVYDPTSHRSLGRQVGFHPNVNSLFSLGIALFLLGFSDQAFAQITASIAEARRLAHAQSLAGSLAVRGILLSLVGESAVLGDWAHQLVTLATEQGFPYWRAQGTIYLGWAKVNKRRFSRGDITAAQRPGCFPRDRSGAADAPLYRPPRESMSDRRTN